MAGSQAAQSGPRRNGAASPGTCRACGRPFDYPSEVGEGRSVERSSRRAKVDAHGGRDREAGGARAVDQRGPELRRRLGRPSPPPRSRASRTSCWARIPGLPKVHLHNPVLAYEVGDEFMSGSGTRRAGQARARSCWSSRARSPTRRSRRRATGPLRHRPARPASRSPPASGSTGWRPRRWAVVAAGTCATYGGIHAMAGQPDRLPWAWPTTSAGTGARKAGIPIVNVPGCPVQPDNFMETLLYLLYQAAGAGADDPARRAAAAHVALRQDRPRGLRPRPATTSRATSPRSTARPSAS